MSARDAAIDCDEDALARERDENELALERRLRRALATARARRAIESVACGFSAAALVLAIELLQRESSSAGPSLAWTIAALAAALAWWLEHAPERRETIERIDRRSAFDGALATFDELISEARPRRSRLFRTELARRLVGRWQASGASRAVLPSHPAMLAVPCACAALWIWAREQPARVADVPALGSASLSAALERVERRASDHAGAASAAALALVDDWRRAADAGHAGAQTLTELAARAKSLRDDPSLPADVRAALAAALDDAGVEAGAPLRASLGDTAFDAPELGVPAEASRAGLAGSAASSSARPGESRSGSTGAASGSAAPDTGTATELPLPRSTSTASGVTSANSSAAAAGPWWAPRYDAVVERWIEARRLQR